VGAVRTGIADPGQSSCLVVEPHRAVQNSSNATGLQESLQRSPYQRIGELSIFDKTYMRRELSEIPTVLMERTSRFVMRSETGKRHVWNCWICWRR
jgi:hypothetical protein